MRPSVGRIVHYVSHGTPARADGSQAYTSECRAAIITEVPEMLSGQPDDGVTVSLCVLNPAGQFFSRQVAYHDGGETPGANGCPSAEGHGNPFRYCSCGWIEASHRGGTWHWPERTD